MDSKKFKDNVVQVSNRKVEEIFDIVESFSYYLSCTNDQFHYNESYLPAKVEDFHRFTVNFQKKNRRLEKLNLLPLIFISNLEMVIFDSYWCYNKGCSVIDIIENPSFETLIKGSVEFEVKCIFLIDDRKVTHCFNAKVTKIEENIISLSDKMKD